MTRGRPIAQRGFSLVEAMVTVALMATLAALAAPSFEGSLARFRVRTTTDSIAAGLQLARSEALRRSQAVQFTLGAQAGNWTVATMSPTATIQQATGAVRGAIAVATSNDETSAIFLASGMVDTSTPRIEQINVTTTVAGVTGLRIEIHAGGQIVQCDPAVATANDPRKC